MTHEEVKQLMKIKKRLSKRRALLSAPEGARMPWRNPKGGDKSKSKRRKTQSSLWRGKHDIPMSYYLDRDE